LLSYQPNYPEPPIVPTPHDELKALACLHIMKEEGEIHFLSDYLAKEVHNLINKIKGWTVATETVLNPERTFGYTKVIFFSYFDIVSSCIAAACCYTAV